MCFELDSSPPIPVISGGAPVLSEDLTLEAASRVVGRTLDAERDRELISEAIAGLDFSRLEESA